MANRERRRSSLAPSTPHQPVHQRLPRLFSQKGIPGEDSSADESSENDEDPNSFLGRVGSYSRLMHAHTKSQMGSPAGTLPSYTKTMHAFTLNQMNDSRRASKSETNSPHTGMRQATLPAKVWQELAKLDLDEAPRGPSNTPDVEKHELVRGNDLGKLRRRSLTAPSVARDFAVVRARDFVVAAR